MGYDIHITRSLHRTDSEDKQISLGELMEYFSSKHDFVYSNQFSITEPYIVTIKGDFFIWKTDEQSIPFKFFKGKLTISSGGVEVIEKMKEIANDLNAIVQGDDGEIL